MNGTELARLIADALRHRPEALDLVLEESDGSVSLSDLHYGLTSCTPHDVTLDEMTSLLQENDRGRFDFSTPGRIRALKNHTTEQVSYKVSEPSREFFYRVESARKRAFLSREGLVNYKKRYIQVYENPLQAFSDAKKRRVKGGLLVCISAELAYHDGALFYQHGKDWYVNSIDSAHLQLEETEEE